MKFLPGFSLLRIVRLHKKYVNSEMYVYLL